ncbi:hypothetical protein ABI59_12285 [Acidobacteria bacterium Mor1]|nr:hypothetical protein ABI59_12285 [Acidobacteria bacterium Mor1]
MNESDRGGSATPAAPDPERIRALVRDLAEGREAALDGLYGALSGQLYGLALWRTASAEDAADVLQETFVRLVESRQRVAAARDPLAYIRRMVHRASIDVHRRRRRRREDSLDAVAFVEPEPSGDADQQLDARRASELLAELPPAQREAIYLRHYAACSFAEIGRATGVPTFTAASRYRLGIERLRKQLGVKS